jgi:hypothetical protein
MICQLLAETSVAYNTRVRWHNNQWAITVLLLRIEHKREIVEKERTGAEGMASQKRREDRRMQRTRQVLQQAFVDVVREKGEALRCLPQMPMRVPSSFRAVPYRPKPTRAYIAIGPRTIYVRASSSVRTPVSPINCNHEGSFTNARRNAASSVVR